MFKNVGLPGKFSALASDMTPFLPLMGRNTTVPWQNIATRDVTTLSLDNSLSEAARILVQRCISCIVVVDDGGHPLGIVTQSNILGAMRSGCFAQTQLKEVMTTAVISVPQTLDSQLAYQLFLQKDVRHLVMVGTDGAVTGVVSETDFRLHMKLSALAACREVATVMNSSVLSLPPDASLREALNLMHARQDGCVLVTEAGRPEGIITERDVLRFFANDPERVVAPLREVMIFPVMTISSSASIHDAAERMLATQTSHLVVVNPQGQLVGMVHEHDLLRSVASDSMDARLNAEATFLRTLINTIPDLVWLKDCDGVFLACNAAFERLLGAKECDIIGKTDLDFLDAKQADLFREIDPTVMVSNTIRRNEEWLSFADGYRGLFETSQSPMRDSTGKLIGVLSIAHDITANRQAQDARERDFRRLADNSPDCISRWDVTGRYLYINPAYARILGGTANALTGTQAAQKCMAFIAHVVTTGEAMTFAHQSVLVNGEQQIHDVSLVPELDDEGRVVSVLGVGRDMTEIYRLQDELSAQESNLRALAESSPGMLGTFYSRPDGSICMPYVSPKIKELFGLDPQDVLDDASPLLDLTHPDDAQNVITSIAESARNMTPWHEEYRIIHPTLGERWMESNTIPQVHPQGGVIWYGYVHDISERKLMERQLRMKEFVLDQAHEAVYLMNRADWSFIYVNDAACHSLGYSREELLGLTLKDIDRELTPQAGRDLWEKVIANGSLTFETRHWRRDGSIFPVEIQGSKVNYEGQEMSLSLVRDITERKRAQAELQRRELEYRSLAENSPDCIARWDLEGRYLYINVVLERALGIAAIDLVGKQHPRMHKHIMASISQAIECGRSHVIKRQAITVDGATQIHDINLVPERDVNGHVVSVLGIGRDMTDIYRMQDAVATSEKAFRSLAESSPDCIIRYDLEQRVLYLNNNLIDVLGLARVEEVQGRRSDQVWPDQRYAAIDVASRRVIASGKQETFELDLLEDRDSPRVDQILVVPERDVYGEIIGTIAFGRDITALRESARRLTHFIDRLPGLAFTFRLNSEGQGCFPYISSAIEKFYGLKPLDVKEDMMALHVLAHPDDRPRIEEAIAKSVRTRTGLRIDFRVCRPGFPERWLDVISVPECLPDGTNLWYGIMLDITERKLAEHSVLTLNSKISATLRAIPDILFEVDRNGHLLRTHTPHLEEFDIQGPDVTGQVVSRLLLPDAAEIVREALREANESGHSSGQIIATRLSDGARWFELSVARKSNFSDADATFLILARNVTERIVAEQSDREHLSFLEGMELVNRTFQGEDGIESMMSRVLDVVLKIFDCDRVFFLYPCDPEAAKWTLPIESHRPEYPGACAFGIDLPHTQDIADKLRLLLNADGPVRFGCNSDHVVPSTIANQFQVQSLMAMAIYPKTGKPWEFGIQQCSEVRNWKTWEERLFHAIGNRLSDSLSAQLTYQNLLGSQEQLRRSNKQLFELSMRRESDREDERKRIAREIHDELGQNLTALRMSISQLRFQFGSTNPELSSHIEHMHKLATLAIKTVRDVTKSLRPPVLDMGICAALSWLVNEFQRSTHTLHAISLPSETIAVDEEHAIAVFRIVQESLTNVVRHACASRVDVTVQATTGSLHICIRDNGKGFDTGKVKWGGFGLLGMTERARMTNGTFEIHTKPGEGTSVTVIIPKTKPKEML
jgi:PAS domain S-box-containing protein